jgi:hypothetical protein
MCLRIPDIVDDDEVARLHLAVEGPYKADHCRY